MRAFSFFGCDRALLDDEREAQLGDSVGPDPAFAVGAMGGGLSTAVLALVRSRGERPEGRDSALGGLPGRCLS
jgi:hypothetical protein